MKADKSKVKRLLKTAKGQIDGVLKMIDEDRYCIDIVTQISASRAVLQRTVKEVLKGHMNSCVLESFSSGGKKEKQEKINEIIMVLEKLNG
ncbi:MAG: metal-sensing transcriptional repressor [Endomicrobium sp.]|jgi:DNA-binding FrmR family transcriptional regulator|nr:metal-sensing transcriptional repressor [Endomicrobium sp.]